jgi:ABC-2 type transport system ATP-binding protein
MFASEGAAAHGGGSSPGGRTGGSTPHVSASGHDRGSTVLEAIDLRKSYGSRVALAGVSFEAAAGELIACIGPNGAGKTTMLSIVAGLQEPDAGSVRRPGGPIGWVPQQPALYRKLSVAENLRLFARLEGVPDVEQTVEGMLAQTRLEERAGEQVQRLSVGNRQRVNIAIGLLPEPPIVLLDEPTTALDPRQRERLWDFIAELARRGTAVVYSTHNVSEAERHADRLLVLADGERLFWGPPDQLWKTVERDGSVGGVTDFEGAFVTFLHQRGH